MNHRYSFLFRCFNRPIAGAADNIFKPTQMNIVYLIAGVEDRPPARRSECLLGMKSKVPSIATRPQAFSLARLGDTLCKPPLCFPPTKILNIVCVLSFEAGLPLVGGLLAGLLGGSNPQSRTA